MSIIFLNTEIFLISLKRRWQWWVGEYEAPILLILLRNQFKICSLAFYSSSILVELSRFFTNAVQNTDKNRFFKLIHHLNYLIAQFISSCSFQMILPLCSNCHSSTLTLQKAPGFSHLVFFAILLNNPEYSFYVLKFLFFQRCRLLIHTPIHYILKCRHFFTTKKPQ